MIPILQVEILMEIAHNILTLSMMLLLVQITLFLKRMDALVSNKESFAFETTLSGRGYIKKIKHWKSVGYKIIIYYLKIDSIEQAIERVKLRVSHGGHNVPEKVIVRRFKKSWTNFQNIYKPLADSWIVFNTSGEYPVVIESSEEKIEGN